MAKLTLADGTIFEGTTEEIFAITEKFGAKSDEPTEVEPLKVGDRVRVLKAGEFGGVDVGQLGKVAKGHLYGSDDKPEYSVKVYGADGDHDYFRPQDLRKATDEEVAEAKAHAEQTAKDAIFTQAGRKPNEYRKGDIVRYEHKLARFITEVAKVDGDKVYFYDTTYGNETEFTYIENGTLKPVAFAESRLDLRK